MLREELVEGLMEDFMKEPVKVLFEFDGKCETVQIVGRAIAVKAAIMTILSKLADYDEIPLVTLIEEFLTVAQITQQDDIREVLQHLGSWER
jgi:hypothetical protein